MPTLAATSTPFSVQARAWSMLSTTAESRNQCYKYEYMYICTRAHIQIHTSADVHVCTRRDHKTQVNNLNTHIHAFEKLRPIYYNFQLANERNMDADGANTHISLNIKLLKSDNMQFWTFWTHILLQVVLYLRISRSGTVTVTNRNLQRGHLLVFHQVLTLFCTIILDQLFLGRTFLDV